MVKQPKKRCFKKLQQVSLSTQSQISGYLRISVQESGVSWTAKLKEVTDHNNKSGNSHKKWKYYSEMADCISMNAAVRPTYTLESSSCVMSNEGEESDSSADGDYSSGTPQKKTPEKGQQRNAKLGRLHQRCSHFSRNTMRKKKWKTKKLR